MTNAGAGWERVLSACRAVFTAPGFRVFQDLICAWVLCLGRRTVTGMIRMIDESRRRPHDACHRLLRVGRWSLLSLWLIMARRVVARLAQGDTLRLDLETRSFTGQAVRSTELAISAMRYVRVESTSCTPMG